MSGAMRRTTRIHLHRVLVCGFAVLGSACGGGSSNPDAAPAAPEAGGSQEAAGPPPPYCTSKSALAGVTNLSGIWVARATGAVVVNAPIVGVMRNQTQFTMLLTIVQQETALTADGRYCDRFQVNPPNAIAPVVIPNAWAHTETPVHRTGKFEVGTDGFPVLSIDLMSEEIGWVLGTPPNSLPTVATDNPGQRRQPRHHDRLERAGARRHDLLRPGANDRDHGHRGGGQPGRGRAGLHHAAERAGQRPALACANLCEGIERRRSHPVQQRLRHGEGRRDVRRGRWRG